MSEEIVEIIISNEKAPIPLELSDDELKIAIDDPPLYKKVKLNDKESNKIKQDKQHVSENNDEHNNKHSISKANHSDDRLSGNIYKLFLTQYIYVDNEEKNNKKDKKEKIKKRDGNSAKKSKHKENNEKCKLCRKRTGEMILCDMCPKSFHFECVDMKKEDIPKGRWFCQQCRY